MSLTKKSPYAGPSWSLTSIPRRQPSISSISSLPALFTACAKPTINRLALHHTPSAIYPSNHKPLSMPIAQGKPATHLRQIPIMRTREQRIPIPSHNPLDIPPRHVVEHAFRHRGGLVPGMRSVVGECVRESLVRGGKGRRDVGGDMSVVLCSRRSSRSRAASCRCWLQAGRRCTDAHEARCGWRRHPQRRTYYFKPHRFNSPPLPCFHGRVDVAFTPRDSVQRPEPILPQPGRRKHANTELMTAGEKGQVKYSSISFLFIHVSE